MVKTPCFQCGGVGLIPGQGTNAAWYGQKKRNHFRYRINFTFGESRNRFFLIFLLIYLFYLASPGLNCSTQHLIVATYGI